MRPRTLRRNLVLIGVGAIAAGTILGTATAKATPLTFLQSLNNNGIVVYDNNARAPVRSGPTTGWTPSVRAL